MALRTSWGNWPWGCCPCFNHQMASSNSQENSVPGSPSSLDTLCPAGYAGSQWWGTDGQPSPRRGQEDIQRDGESLPGWNCCLTVPPGVPEVPLPSGRRRWWGCWPKSYHVGVQGNSLSQSNPLLWKQREAGKQRFQDSSPCDACLASHFPLWILVPTKIGGWWGAPVAHWFGACLQPKA